MDSGLEAAKILSVLRIEQIVRGQVPTDEKNFRLLVFRGAAGVDDSILEDGIGRRHDVEEPLATIRVFRGVAVKEIAYRSAGEAAAKGLIATQAPRSAVAFLLVVELIAVDGRARRTAAAGVTNVVARHNIRAPTFVVAVKIAFRVAGDDLPLVPHTVIASNNNGLVEEGHIVADGVQKHLAGHILVTDKAFEFGQ